MSVRAERFLASALLYSALVTRARFFLATPIIHADDRCILLALVLYVV